MKLPDLEPDRDFEVGCLTIEDEVFHKVKFIDKVIGWEPCQAIGTLSVLWHNSQKMKVHEAGKDLLKFMTEIESDAEFHKFCDVCCMPEMNFLREVRGDGERIMWRICGNQEKINKILIWEGREPKK